MCRLPAHPFPLITIMRFLTHFILTLSSWVAHCAFFVCCFIAAYYAVEFGLMERYGQGDTVSPTFYVLVQDEHGIRPTRLENWRNTQTLVRQDRRFFREDGEGGYRLRQIAPDTYELFTDLDTAMITQTYRLTPDNRVIPLSWRGFNAISFILILPVGLVFFTLGRWLARRMVHRWKRRAVPHGEEAA